MLTSAMCTFESKYTPEPSTAVSSLQSWKVKTNSVHVAGFHIIVCGLDSIIARRWINGMLVIRGEKHCTL